MKKTINIIGIVLLSIVISCVIYLAFTTKQKQTQELYSVTLPAKPYTFKDLRVKLSPNFTTNVYLAIPPEYNANVKYPVCYVGKGLGESYTSVQNSSIFKLLKANTLPSDVQYIFVHIDQGSTNWIDYIPYTTGELIKMGYNIDTDNSFIVGHSAGGGYAMSAQFGRSGTTVDATIIGSRFRAIVANAPNQDMRENNWGVAAQLQIPVWVTVGANDQLAYINRAKAIAENAGDKTFVELLIRTGIGHGGWDDIYSGKVKMADGKNMWQFFASKILVKPDNNTPYIVQEVVLKLGLGTLRVYSDSTYKITTP